MDRSFFYFRSDPTVAIITATVTPFVILPIIATIAIIGGCCTCIAVYARRMIGKAPYNRDYVLNGYNDRYGIGNSIFRSGSYETYYFKSDIPHGPFTMKLGFHPKADYTVHGGGADDVGTFVINGIYSPQTLRMGLMKEIPNWNRKSKRKLRT